MLLIVHIAARSGRIGNPKFESRNPKQIRMTAESRNVFGFWISGFLRISRFEFRIFSLSADSLHAGPPHVTTSNRTDQRPPVDFAVAVEAAFHWSVLDQAAAGIWRPRCVRHPRRLHSDVLRATRKKP